MPNNNDENFKPLYRNIYRENEENLSREERIAKSNKKRILNISIVAIITLECMIGIGVIMYFMIKG